MINQQSLLNQKNLAEKNLLLFFELTQKDLSQSSAKFMEIEQNLFTLMSRINIFEKELAKIQIEKKEVEVQENKLPNTKENTHEEEKDTQKSRKEPLLHSLFSISLSDSPQSFNNQIIFLKQKRFSKRCTNCPHINAKHYAKNMCVKCYHAKGRNKNAWNCEHVTKKHYALGLCQNCYHVNYVHKKKQKNIL